MSKRLELQSKLEELLGNKNVYYQPPESIKMEYPAIIYSKSDIVVRNANNKMYTRNDLYIVTVVSKKPDNPVIDKLLELPLCSYDRHYVSDNLNHDVFNLYF